MNQSTKRLDYTPDPTKFDLRTHVWDSQGNLVKTNHYRMFNIDGRNVFERPKNSGNLWGENNQPCGRVELTFGENGKISSKKFAWDAEHVEYTAPLTGAEALHYQLEQEKAHSAKLAEELAQLKGVREGFPADEKKSEKRGR